MALYITERIRQREFGPAISAAEREALLEGTRLCLAQTISARGLPKGTRLIKYYATTDQGPRRIAYLLIVDEGDLFVPFYRDKKDKVGENVSPRNPAFVAALERHLELLREDIAADRVEAIIADPPPQPGAPGLRH